MFIHLDWMFDPDYKSIYLYKTDKDEDNWIWFFGITYTPGICCNPYCSIRDKRGLHICR